MFLQHRFQSVVMLALGLLPSALAADWPQWGGGPTRNPVSLEKRLPLDFKFKEVEDGIVTQQERGITWRAELGGRTMIPPVVADGLVWVGTNTRDPMNDKTKESDRDGGLLLCFRESDGKLLWEHRTPRLSEQGVDWIEDFPGSALGSCPLVDGDRLWYVNNRNEVVCFDIAPLKKGTGKPTEIWKLDMRKKLSVFPSRRWMCMDSFAASVAGYKNKLYVVTHNGIDASLVNLPKPEAPSLVCLEKTTGKVVWKDNSPGKDILFVQTSSPLVVEIKGKAQVMVGQGDGWLRSFDPATGKLIWKSDLNAKDADWELDGTGNRNYIVATPILYENRVYIATGRLGNYAGPGALYCIDPTKEGDVSRELQAGMKKGKPNPNSAVLWFTPPKVPDDAPAIEETGEEKVDLLRSRDYYFGRSVAGCVAHDGLVYAADIGGVVYCFDAKTGKLYWGTRIARAIRGQLLWADGHVVVVSDDGDVAVFKHGKEKKRVLTTWIPRFQAGPVFANGTLYLTTEHTLYAIRKMK